MYLYVKQDNRFVVYKQNDAGRPEGEPIATFDKEVDAKSNYPEIKCYDYYYVPYGVTSFAEFDQYNESLDKKRQMTKLVDAWQQMSYNIFSDHTIEDKVGAIENLTKELSMRMRRDVAKDKWSLKSFLGIQKQENTEIPMMIWKDASGQYKWFGVYSNSYIDKHKDILTEESHLDFVKAVESGEWDLPELLVWHIPGSRIGKAEFVAYDEETGLSYAGGYIDPSKAEFAEFLMTEKDKGMSHGMPKETVKRDTVDRRLIKRYRSLELSVLPLTEAANEITGFLVGDNDMSVKMNPTFVDWAKKAGIDVDSADNALRSKAENAAGLERKEEVVATELVAAATEGVVSTETIATEAPKTEEKAADAQNVLTKSDFQAGITELVEALNKSQFEPIASVIQTLFAEVQSLSKQVEQLSKADEEKVTEKALLTPRWSMNELVGKSVFAPHRDEIALDGRSKLAQDSPEITKENKFVSPFDAIKQGVNYNKPAPAQQEN